MIKDVFMHCGECANKIFLEYSVDREYYCPIADIELPDGIVYDSTDASKCINQGVFTPINQRLIDDFKINTIFDNIQFE